MTRERPGVTWGAFRLHMHKTCNVRVLAIQRWPTMCKSTQQKQTLQDPEIIRRFAEWYARCIVRIEKDKAKSEDLEGESGSEESTR